MTSAATPAPATHEFKAEIKQLLDILIHSVYTTKDVFVRELISNAADALEKVRFLQASGQPVADSDLPLEIRLEPKRENEQPVLVITDTGVGMTAEEVHENIGTIAHSGATAFLKQLGAKGEPRDMKDQLSLIGRFGVGFYSIFMAADRVVLTTRSAQPDSKPVRWTSDGLGSYTLETVDEELPRGTRIELHLKSDSSDFANENSIKQTVERYSNFVSFPIRVDGEQVNQTGALWREPAGKADDEKANARYDEFYKLVSHDSQPPIARVHFAADAPIQFSALLFVPQTNTEAFGFGRGEVSLQLYVKRVLIDGENKNLLPQYLRFVKGVVESDDLPLNVSRETLQENRVVVKIRETLAKRVLEQLQQLANDQPEKYAIFWRSCGQILKEGYLDYGNRDRFAELLRFGSSRAEDEKGLVSLAEYAGRLAANQKAIYFLSGPSRESLERDPRLEMFRRRKLEVLYLYDLADEFVAGSLNKYKDLPLVSADQAKPEDLPAALDEQIASNSAATEDVASLIVRFKNILGERIIDVRTSQRLVDSPACLVTDDQHMSGHMDKMFRMMNKSSELPKRVLELNPGHPLIISLSKMVATPANDEFVEQACEQLFEGSMLVDGYLTDPHRLVERMNLVLTHAAQRAAAG